MPQHLTEREQSALRYCVKHLDKVQPYRDKPDPTNPTRGKCYIASIALLDYLGGVEAGYKLVKAEDKNGDHYWVQSKTAGTILDPTIEQFEIMGVDPPYKLGRGVGRRNNFKQHLPLLEAMRQQAAEDHVEEQRELLDGDSDDRERLRRPEDDLFGRQMAVSKELGSATLSDAQKELLTKAWTALVADWAARPEEFIRSCFPKGALAVQFVRALLYGEEIPRYATMAYVPHIFDVAGSQASMGDMLKNALKDPRIVRGIRFYLDGDTTFTKFISANLPVLGYRMPRDFPIGLARGLIQQYCPEGGHVLDPCHGWGGRLVGFLLSHARSYTGIDPAPHSPCLREMFDDLRQYVSSDKACTLINKPFEDVGSTLADGWFDFAFTSPPYYNTEKYQGVDSSWQRYKKLDEWVEGFYRPLIVGVAKALKPGAYLCLQVTPKFRMVELAKEIGQQAGLEHKQVHDAATLRTRYNSVTADKSGSTDPFEVVAVFRKTNAVNNAPTRRRIRL